MCRVRWLRWSLSNENANEDDDKFAMHQVILKLKLSLMVLGDNKNYWATLINIIFSSWTSESGAKRRVKTGCVSMFSFPAKFFAHSDANSVERDWRGHGWRHLDKLDYRRFWDSVMSWVMYFRSFRSVPFAFPPKLLLELLTFAGSSCSCLLFNYLLHTPKRSGVFLALVRQREVSFIVWLPESYRPLASWM